MGIKGRESNIHEREKIQTLCGGRKLADVEVEEEVLSWIQKRPSNMLHVSRKPIMFEARPIYHEKCGDNEQLEAVFVASNGWLMKFTKRNNTHLRKDEQQ